MIFGHHQTGVVEAFTHGQEKKFRLSLGGQSGGRQTPTSSVRRASLWRLAIRSKGELSLSAAFPSSLFPKCLNFPQTMDRPRRQRVPHQNEGRLFADQLGVYKKARGFKTSRSNTAYPTTRTEGSRRYSLLRTSQRRPVCRRSCVWPRAAGSCRGVPTSTLTDRGQPLFRPPFERLLMRLRCYVRGNGLDLSQEDRRSQSTAACIPSDFKRSTRELFILSSLQLPPPGVEGFRLNRLERTHLSE